MNYLDLFYILPLNLLLMESIEWTPTESPLWVGYGQVLTPDHQPMPLKAASR